MPYYFFVPPIPVPFYARGEAEIGIAVGGVVNGWLPNGYPNLSARLELDPFPRLEGAFGVGVYGIASVEGYVGGHVRLVLESPPMPPTVTERVIFLGGGIRVITLVWHQEWPLAEWVCDLDGACPPFWDLSGNHPSFWDSGGGAAPQPLPRDYLVPTGRYASFTANDNQAKSVSSPGTVETVMQSNVFGQSTPTLVPLGSDRFAVWVYDDPTRTPTNRSELVWSFYDSVSQTWSTPAAVADEGTADFHPQLAVTSNGDAFAVWENVKEVLTEPIDPNDPTQQQAKFDEMRSKMDIVVARFNPLSQTWSAPTVLVDNDYMDSAPRIAAAANSTALVTWFGNATNHPMGTTAEPNRVRFATYDGASWTTAPDPIAYPDIPSVLKCDLAYDGTVGLLLYSGDCDGDSSTPEDRELFALQYVSGGWADPFQVTNDVVEDGCPQVAYDNFGMPLMAWYRGGVIASASDLGLSDLTTAVEGTGGENSGLADFRMATGTGGRIGLVWQDASEDLVDLWYAMYDPGSPLAPWSKSLRLTQDDSMEYAASPAYADNGDLLVIYDKAAVTHETQIIDYGGEPVTIIVPVLGQVDLCLAEHTKVGDLAVYSQDLSLSNPNPLPGEVTIISAIVHNQGDVASSGIAVEFLDGVTVIGTATIAGPLVGGDSATVSVDWTATPSSTPHTLSVVVDPAHQQWDDDLSNNTAIVSGVMKPDLVIDSLTSQRIGASYQLVARVLNTGALDASNVEVEFRKGRVDGRMMGSAVITGPIMPGAFVDVAVEWTPRSHPRIDQPTSLWAYAIADSAGNVDESDEDNNTGKTAIWSGKPQRQ